MSFYTARIELQATSDGEYQSLHHRMEAAGFSRPADPAAHDAHLLLLGPAEYLCESDRDLDGVFEAARGATAAVGSAFTILVCESSTQKWIGLRVSKPA